MQKFDIQSTEGKKLTRNGKLPVKVCINGDAIIFTVRDISDV
jgi:hypothetical protein